MIVELATSHRESEKNKEGMETLEHDLRIWELACLIMTLQVIHSEGTHRFIGKYPNSFSLPPIGQYFLTQLIPKHPEITSQAIISEWLVANMISIFRNIVVAIQSNKLQSFIDSRLPILNLSSKKANQDLIRIILGEGALQTLVSESLTLTTLENIAKTPLSTENFLQLIEKSTIPMHNGQCGAESTKASLKILKSLTTANTQQSATTLTNRYMYDLTGDFGTSKQQDVHFFGIGLNVLRNLIAYKKEGKFFYRVHTESPLEDYIGAYEKNIILLPSDIDGQTNSVGNLHYLLSLAITSGKKDSFMELLALNELIILTDSTEMEFHYSNGEIDVDFFRKSVSQTLDKGGHVACLVNWSIYNNSAANQWTSPRHAIVIVGRHGPYYRIYDSSLPNGGMQIMDSEHVFNSLFNQQWIEYGLESDNNQNYFDQPTIEEVEDDYLTNEIKKWILEAAKRSKNVGEKSRHRLLTEIAGDQNLLSLLTHLLKPLITNSNIEGQLRPIAGNVIYAFQKTYEELTDNTIEIDNLTCGELFSYLGFLPFQKLFQLNLSTYPPYSIPERYIPIIRASYPIISANSQPSLRILDVGSGSMSAILAIVAQLRGGDIQNHQVNGIDLYAPQTTLTAIDDTEERHLFRRSLEKAQNSSRPANIQSERIYADVRQNVPYLEQFGSEYNLIIASFCLHQIGWTEHELMYHLLPLANSSGSLFIHCGIETQTEDGLYEIRAYALKGKSIRFIGVIGALDKDQATVAYQTYDYSNPYDLLKKLNIPPNVSLLFSQEFYYSPIKGGKKGHVETESCLPETSAIQKEVEKLMSHFIFLSKLQTFNTSNVDLSEKTNLNQIFEVLSKMPLKERLKVVSKYNEAFEFWRPGSEIDQVDSFYYEILFKPLLELDDAELKRTILEQYIEWKIALQKFESYLFLKTIDSNNYPIYNDKQKKELLSGITLFYKILFFLFKINCIDFEGGEKLFVDDIKTYFVKLGFPDLKKILECDENEFLALL